MISLRFVFLAAFLLVGFSSTIQAAPKVEIPDTGWLVNTWGNTANAILSFEQGPDNKNAIRIRFEGSRPANVSMPKSFVAESAADWPTEFHGFQTFVWNDGSLRRLRVVFTAPTEVDGEFTPLGFSGTMIVDHEGWKRVTCKQAINYQHLQARLNPSQINSIFVTVDEPDAEIGLGSITWITEGTELQRSLEGNVSSIFKAPLPPVIDGDGGDAAWDKVPEIPLSYIKGTGAGTPTNQTTLRMVYDEDNLYILAKAPFQERQKLKATITEHDAELWLDEDIEIFLYPEMDPRKYYQFIVNPLGTKGDLARILDQVSDRIEMKIREWNPEWKVVAKVGESAWQAEIVIPWKAIGAEHPPALLQFQAVRNDTTADQVALWSLTNNHPATGLGFLMLRDSSRPSLSIQEPMLRRDAQNRYVFTGMALAEDNLDGLCVKAYLCSPRAAPEIFTESIPTNGKSAEVEITFDSKSVSNGKYLAALEFIPGNKKLLPAGEAYYFVQTLPSVVKFSDIVFNPIPKKLTWKEGVFIPSPEDLIRVEKDATERTVKTAAYLARRMHGIFGLTPEIRRESGGRLSLKIDQDHVRKATGSDSPEAYTLEVTPGYIRITGANEAGLYYGVVTLIQLMQGPKLPNAPIRALSIVDWPTYTHRVIGTYEQAHLKKDMGDGKGGHQLERYKEWIENSVAGNKYNILLMGWADQINYKSIPEVHHKSNFSPAEIRELFDFAREHFLEASPAVLYGSHSSAWLKHFPELKESGWREMQMDATLPGTYALMGRIFNELMDIAGPQSRYLANYNDEWWHHSRTIKDSEYKGTSRQDLLYKFLVSAHEIVTKHGKKMIMCTDMLHPRHNGGPPWNLSAIVDRLPKDIIMATWSESNDFFAERGFKETWTLANGFGWENRAPSTSDSGYGQIFYLLFQSLFNQTDQQRLLNYCYLTTFTTANYAWNKDAGEVMPTEDWVLQKMPAYLGSFSFKPNPMAGETLTPLEMPQTDSVPLLKEISAIHSVGEIPVSPGVALADPKDKVLFHLPEDMKASSFYILGAVYPKEKATIAKLQKIYRTTPSARPYGLIVGTCRLMYEDGSQAEVDIRLGRNMALFQYTPALNRYGAEIRTVYPLTPGGEEALTQFELINPHPEKTIKSFEVTGNFSEAPILLCGLTARSVRGSEPIASTNDK